MILLDTNVVSEWMKATPEPAVIAWLDLQPANLLYLPSITKAEIETGIALLPAGRRRNALYLAAETLFDEFKDRCLPLDCKAASAYAKILSRSRHAGRPISVEDAQIAAIALTKDMTLATRNEHDFDFLDELTMINPWKRTPA